MDILNFEILKRIFICNKPDGIPESDIGDTGV